MNLFEKEMRMRVHVFITLAVVIVAASFGPVSAQKPNAAEEAIRAADQGWARVFGAKDLKASVDYCADDASFMAPNAPMAVGKQAISQSFAFFFSLPDIKLNWHPTKIEVARSGELGYSSGAYEMSFKDPAGKPGNDKGKYVTIWKKQQDGSWKVIYDIFNSDLPPTAP
jgi:ketosteroid isomerase-like protein